MSKPRGMASVSSDGRAKRATSVSIPTASSPDPATPRSSPNPNTFGLQQATALEARTRCYEPDAAFHFEGDGNAAWGTKFVLVAARTPDVHGRIILDVEWAPTPGGEARTAVDCFTRPAPHMPGAQGVIYDTALRGVHHQHLLRELGLLSINRVTAAKAGAKSPAETSVAWRRTSTSKTRPSCSPMARPAPCGSTRPVARSVSQSST